MAQNGTNTEFKKLVNYVKTHNCAKTEVYEYLNKLELFLNKPITYLKPKVSFQHIYDTRKILPKPQNRWCTVELKTKTMQNFIKKLNAKNQAIINLYIGIRADEAQRVKTATSNNPNIKEQFLFV